VLEKAKMEPYLIIGTRKALNSVRMKIHKKAILKCEKIYILKTKSCRSFSFGSQAICKPDPAALRPCLAEVQEKSHTLQRV
jgi:hypothetical protein